MRALLGSAALLLLTACVPPAPAEPPAPSTTTTTAPSTTTTTVATVGSLEEANRALASHGTPERPITVAGAGLSVTGDCLKVTGGHLVVTGFDVHDCKWEGISVTGHHNVIEGNVVRNNVTGVFIRQGAADNRVLGNEIRDNNRMSVNSPEPGGDSGAFGVLLQGDRTEVAFNTITGHDAASYDYVRDGAAIEVYGAQGSSVHDNVADGNDAFAELGHSRSADNVFADNLVTSGLERSIFLVTRGAKDGFGPVLRTTLTGNTVTLTGAKSKGVVCYGGCSPEILVARGNTVRAVLDGLWSDGPFVDDGNVWIP